MSKTPSAFDLLKSANKKRARPSHGNAKESDAPRKKQDKAQGSSFQPCPVCNKAIASALLDFHVNGCLEASSGSTMAPQCTAQQVEGKQQQHVGAGETAIAVRHTSLAQPSAQQPELHASASSNAEAGQKEHSQSFSGCTPLSHNQNGNERHSTAHPDNCEASQAQVASKADVAIAVTQHPLKPPDEASAHGRKREAEEQHVDNGLHFHREHVSEQPATQQRRTEPAAGKQEGGVDSQGKSDSIPQHASQQMQAQPKAAQNKTAPAGNAFAHMMQKQKERAQTWTFYLGRAEDGHLFWHLWRDVKGSAPMPDIITHRSGQDMSVKAPNQETIQRCKQQVAWSAESQASLADLECRIDDSVDRAAAGKVTLRLCTNIEPRHGGRLDMSSLLWTSGTAGRPWEYTGPASLLKSALQKNIRRGRAEEAVRCAQRLLQSEPGELLRRACVISVEDALLHPQLPLLGFLMAAVAKGYILGRTLASACLRIIHDMAVAPVQDKAPKEQDDSSDPGPQRAGLALSEAEANLIRSMLLRAAYGGLQGDIAMLRRFSLLWIARLTGLAGPPPGFQPGTSGNAAARGNPWQSYMEATLADARPPGMVVGWGSLGRLKPDDIPPAAVDFHISSIIEGLLVNPNILSAATAAAAKLGGDPAGALKSAMWNFSGSCNHRALLQGRGSDEEAVRKQRTQSLQPLWEAARHAAEAWAHQYINARFRPA